MRIGIWERGSGSNRYERSSGEWPDWADTAGFSRVPDRRRVLLLGESVARGLFYEPLVTPAGLIQQCLDACTPEAVEVVDLAKSGARCQDILDIAEAALDLAPDVVIVFAGNNWKYELTEWPSGIRRGDDARALERDGVAGVLHQREDALAEAAQSFVRRVCDLFQGLAATAFVLPESNLLNWHPVMLAPVLGGDRDMAWHRLMRETRRRVRAADADGVLECCEALHRLDGGVSDEPYRYKARIHQDRGAVAGALADYRRARDVRLWCDGIDPSWLPSVGAAAAKTTALDRGAVVVDLIEALPAYAASGIPDRSIFADFCHLNGRGLVAAATEISCVVGSLLGLPVTREMCAGRLRKPAAAVEAAATFCASFVNADFAQPEESMDFYARTAVEAAPEIVMAMEAYCAAPAIAVPWWMRSLDVAGFANAQHFLRGIGRIGRYLYDDLLVASFTSQINAVRGKANGGTHVRREGALVPGVRTNLLDPILAPAWRPIDWEGLLDTLPGRPTGYRHYFRAHTDRSRFVFTLTDPAAINVEFTMRLGTPGAGTAQVLLNNDDLGIVPLGERWRASRFRVLPGQVKKGRNELEIRWLRDRLETTPFPVLARRLEHGLGQELSVVFGEVYSLHATLLPESDGVA
jgi:hypothetical protein